MLPVIASASAAAAGFMWSKILAHRSIAGVVKDAQNMVKGGILMSEVATIRYNIAAAAMSLIAVVTTAALSLIAVVTTIGAAMN